MAHSLQEFLNAANADTIRCTNQFQITITTGYSDIDAQMENTLLYGQSFTVPQRSTEFAEVSFKGYSMPLVPTKMTMDQEHTMTVLDDVNGTNRRLFLAWMAKVMNPAIDDGSLFEGDRGVSKSVIRLELFDKDNKTVIQTYKFQGVQVKSVGNTSLTYEGGDKSTFEVGFNSLYWQCENHANGAFTDQK